MEEQKKPIPIRGIDKDIYHRAKVAAVRVKETVGAWITQAIRERLNREKEL